MPFTAEQFFRVFERYNQAVYPMQIVLMLAAIAAVIAVIRPKSFSNKLISILLSILWLWSGIVYHLIFFTEINPAADIFGAMFVLQGLFFFYQGVGK
jgi:disulfide bond formation protein DsbB